VIVGGGGHAASVADVVASCIGFLIIGYVDHEPSSQAGLSAYEWLGDDSVIPDFIETGCSFVLGVGQIPYANRRVEIKDRLLQAGATLPSFIASSAVVSPSASIGAGTVLHHGSIVNAGAQIGDFCIVNSSALIEHGTCIADHCHIATGATVNGDCSIGARSFVGSGAIIFQGVNLVEDSVIRAGEVVARSPANSGDPED